MVAAIRAQAGVERGDERDRRRELIGQLERLQDIYVLGDLTERPVRA